jgi:RNA polymerase sigma-70 factor (ECF subfamily)
MMTPSTPFMPFTPYTLPPSAALARAEPERVPRPTSPAIELARAAAAGDTEATRRLVIDLGPRIVRVVRAVLGGSHAELEDVQQQAMLAFVQAVPTFRGECEPTYFASRIAARVALIAARRTRAARARRDEAVDPDELVSSERPHDAMVLRRRTDLLRELLATIAPEQAETLTLRIVLGWSLPEVAAATAAPLNTVRSRIRLAKAALRTAIDDDPALAEELGVGILPED